MPTDLAGPSPWRRRSEKTAANHIMGSPRTRNSDFAEDTLAAAKSTPVLWRKKATSAGAGGGRVKAGRPFTYG